MSSPRRDAVPAVAAFLEDAVLPGVAQEQRSELRAAIKLLRSCDAELDAAPAVLAEQTRELRDLEAATAGAGDAAPVPGGPAPATLRELRARDDLARHHASRAIAQLQQRLRDPRDGAPPGTERAAEHLRAYYEVLGRHAARRAAWQTVFPVPQNEEGVVA